MSDLVLRKSLPYLLGIVAHGVGVSLRTDPRATTAGTNGKVVILPPLPYTGGELAIYSLGFIVHEAGHLRRSDFSVLAEMAHTPLLKMLVNIIEDVRIERLINGVFPGARFWLNALTRKFVDKGLQGVVDPSAELTTILVRYLQDWLYESVLGYDAVRGVGERQRALWQGKVSPELAREVEKLAVDAVWSASTREVVTAATAIIELIQDEAANASGQQSQTGDSPEDSSDGEGGESPKQSTDENASAQAGDESDGDGDPGMTPADDPGESEGLPGTDPQASGAPSDDPGGQSCDEPATGQSDASQVDPQQYAKDLEDLLASPELPQAADRGDVIRDEMSTAVGEMNANRESTFTLPNVHVAAGARSDADAVNRVRGASTALRARMDEVLQARSQRRFSTAEKGKRLSRDAARRISLGDTRIYQVRAEAEKIDTAVHVLIDISGSMSTSGRCPVAIDAALALGLALDEVEGVKYSVSAFPYHSSDVVELVKPGESIRDVAGRFKLMSPNGTTPLDKGLIHAHTVLMTTEAQRRVCLVITDGEPDDLFAMRMVAKMGEDDGIEHMAIGIECPVGHISKNACVVSNLDDLPKQVMAMMQSVVLLPMAA